MNQRNVDAMLALLVESGALYPDGDTGGLASIEKDRCRELAAFLAYRGVLVPSALTDEECKEVVWQSCEGDDPYVGIITEVLHFRQQLERIAKGEG